MLLKERTGGSYGLYAFDNSAGPRRRNLNGADIAAVGASALPLNTWSHLAATFDGSSLRLYVNGSLVSTRAAPGAVVPSTGSLMIGGNSVWGELFQGWIT